MLQLKIPANRMRYVIDEVQARFDPLIVQRGWDYYHKGRVKELDLLNGYEVHAIVRGNDIYEAMLDLEQFDRSSCTCPFGGWCKHMAAAVFALYVPHGRPELLLQELKRGIQSRQRGARSTAAKKGKAERIVLPQPTDRPETWHKFFDQRFYGYSLANVHAIDAFPAAAKEALEPLAADWQPPLRELYALHVRLFVMRKLDHFAVQNQASYVSFYYETSTRSAAAQCVRELVELARGMDPDAIRRAAPKAWEETIDYVRTVSLQGKPGPVDWTGVYRTLWQELFARGADIREERERLVHEMERQNAPSRQKDACRIALAHFDFMAGDDERAMQVLSGLHQIKAADYEVVLGLLQETEQWDRLLRWLRWLMPALAHARQDEFHRICAFWQEAARHRPEQDEWLEVMRDLLPRSYSYYTQYLIRAGRYRQWVDLQLAHRADPAQLHAEYLKAVEEHDPALLLPLYHQSVERLILEKNRPAYKMAVRQLRKLHGVYKKLKLTERWQLYVESLSVRFSRLRAFQEELNKGKWLKWTNES